MSELGFGFLRLPMEGNGCDLDAVCAMTDLFLEKGGRYFDTCYTYLDGMSEQAIRECLTRRHSRGSFILADKLPGYLCSSKADSQKFFDESRRRCGVDSFDVYMLHWLNGKNLASAEKYDQFGFLEDLKARGLARRTGFSFHDSASLLDEILTKHPEIDVVQIQLNYLDWDSAGIESGKCYNVCVRHGKPVIVMEPVKGGTLASLPEAAAAELAGARPEWSPTRWALNFALSQPRVEVVLSGMGSVSQVEENMLPARPLTGNDMKALHKAAGVISLKTAVACTGCGYCTSYCPRDIAIPRYFSMYNELQRCPQDAWKIKPAYESLARECGRASECIECGSCEAHCTQRLEIIHFMKLVAAAMEDG